MFVAFNIPFMLINLLIVIQLEEGIQLFVPQWTVTCQVLVHGILLARGGVGCLAILKRVVLTHGSNLHLLILLHCKQILYQLSVDFSLFIFFKLIYFY